MSGQPGAPATARRARGGRAVGGQGFSAGRGVARPLTAPACGCPDRGGAGPRLSPWLQPDEPAAGRAGRGHAAAGRDRDPAGATRDAVGHPDGHLRRVRRGAKPARLRSGHRKARAGRPSGAVPWAVAHRLVPGNGLPIGCSCGWPAGEHHPPGIPPHGGRRRAALRRPPGRMALPASRRRPNNHNNHGTTTPTTVTTTTTPLVADAGRAKPKRSRRPVSPNRRKSPLTLPHGVKLELVLIPAGEFLMGSPDSDKDTWTPRSRSTGFGSPSRSTWASIW